MKFLTGPDIGLQKITNLLFGSTDNDAMAYGQRPIDLGVTTTGFPTITSNSNVLTTVWNSSTMPASKLAVGTVVGFALSGDFDNIATSGSFTWATRINATSADVDVMPSQTALATGSPWRLECEAIVLATGVSGSVLVSGCLFIPTAAGGSYGEKVINGTVTVDISAGMTVGLSVKTATSNAANTIRTKYARARQLNLP